LVGWQVFFSFSSLGYHRSELLRWIDFQDLVSLLLVGREVQGLQEGSKVNLVNLVPA
jgi:hypothetical protein